MNYIPLPTHIGERANRFISKSCIVALAIGSLAGLSYFRTTIHLENNNYDLFFIYCDPFITQFIAFVHCSICLAYWNFEKNKNIVYWKHFLNSVAVLSVLFLIYYIVNDVVFKYAFDRPRPSILYLKNIGIISRMIDIKTGGAPSGFAARGIMFLVISYLVTLDFSKHYSGIKSIFTKSSVVINIQLTLLIITCTVRVITGFHYIFDMCLGISMGIFLIWTIILLINSILDKKSLHSVENLGTIVFSIIFGFFLIGFYYSRDASVWVYIILVIVLLSAFIQFRAKNTNNVKNIF